MKKISFKKCAEITKRFDELEFDLERAFDSSSGNRWHYNFFRRFRKLKNLCLGLLK